MRSGARWLAAAAVAAVLVLLSALDLADRSFGRWAADRPFFTSTLTGVLVLLVAVLIVDRLVAHRDEKDQSRSVAAQATIVMAEGARATAALDGALNGKGDRLAAGDEVKTYLAILSMATPVLLGPRFSRGFLESAQALGADLTIALAEPEPSPETRQHLNGAVDRLRDESAPLLEFLDPEHRLPVSQLRHLAEQPSPPENADR
jgi:uncharacterized membrane protein